MLNFVEKELDDAVITSDKANIKAAATLLNVTIDHAQGIRILLSQGAYPSAAALMRVVFETYIRAMWVWECADKKQLDTFINKDKVISPGGKAIHFKDLVKAVIEFATMLTCLAFSGVLDLAGNKNGELVSSELLQLIEPWAFNKSNKKDALTRASS